MKGGNVKSWWGMCIHFCECVCVVHVCDVHSVNMRESHLEESKLYRN